MRWHWRLFFFAIGLLLAAAIYWWSSQELVYVRVMPSAAKAAGGIFMPVAFHYRFVKMNVP